jgi:ribonuclease-3
MNKLAELSRRLGYTFADKTLLEAAVSHRSIGSKNYERLEFLGDAVLNFVIAAALFRKYSKAKEGELSRLRASLVNGETVAELAHELNVGDYLRLGVGELKSGGTNRESILADALEAIIGAIYLDAGFSVSEQHILQWYAPRLEKIVNVKIPKDPKTQLQEYLQAKQMALPEYKILNITGESHAQLFQVTCKISSPKYTSRGEGNNRRRAEQAAAQAMLVLLGERS